MTGERAGSAAGGQRQVTVVAGVIGSDMHFVGNTILRYALEEAGYRVVNLGTQVSQDEFIKAAVETDADAIFVSSLNGLAEIDCQGFGDRCREAGLENVLLYLGGNVSVSLQSRDWQEAERTFREMGFHRTYPPGVSLKDVLTDFRADLERRRASD